MLLNGESAYSCNRAGQAKLLPLLLALSGTANLTTTRRTVPQR